MGMLRPFGSPTSSPTPATLSPRFFRQLSIARRLVRRAAVPPPQVGPFLDWQLVVGRWHLLSLHGNAVRCGSRTLDGPAGVTLALALHPLARGVAGGVIISRPSRRRARRWRSVVSVLIAHERGELARWEAHAFSPDRAAISCSRAFIRFCFIVHPSYFGLHVIEPLFWFCMMR
jgi:hypothetical protein